ncbi:MAG TPA: hypothetical protein VKE94_18935, partial [Gemmataceae bacterium]|nr:hypothetical protein [Gemmataceae bacterium]
SKLTQAERQTVQNIYDRMTSQPAAPPAPAPIRPPVSAPPAAPPEPPVAPAAPAAAPIVPPEPVAPAAPAAPKASAAEIAQQLEEMTRPDRVTGFLKANFQDLTPADIDKFDPHDWELIGKGAGGQTPNPEQIQEIRSNIAASAAPLPPEVATMPPAQAEAAVAARQARKPPATAPAAQPEPAPPDVSPAQISRTLADMMRESGTAATAPPAPGPPPPTAPELRIEAFAQHFARDTEMTPEAVRSIADNPNASLLLEKLGESLGIEGRPAPGEIEQIAERVGELRGQPPPAAPGGTTPAAAELRFAQEKAVGDTFGAPEGWRGKLNQAADEAQGRIQQFWKDQGKTLNAGLPVHVLADYSILGARKIIDGFEKFGDWSKAMVDTSGEQVQPHLRAIWQEAKHIAGKIGWGPPGDAFMPLGNRLTVKAGPVSEDAPAIAQKSVLPGFRYNWPLSDGTTVELTPKQHRALLDTLAEMRDKANIPGYTGEERAIQYGTKTSKATEAPWRQLPGVNQRALDRIIEQFASR